MVSGFILPICFQHYLTWLSVQGGGARYPYPKYVWSPAGGWWTRPQNWLSNTAIAFSGILAVTYLTWSVSAKNERRTVQPDRFIPSMLVCSLSARVK
ncbi:hypothetical protein M378DRAFT_74917 [Amanita muscaria Koide BX008]|uniref:Uncharacterized protein n=1 Tax=Amanita muscaria (strain Koide BX008) TaxID=946122 RepID=A0A0C2TI31_AMAMK|nr:hypothetical protein M378DRAFT_74917 [Amanita muscaria Koide BX008]